MREQIYRLRNNQPDTEFQKILLQSDGGDKNEQNGNKKGTAQRQDKQDSITIIQWSKVFHERVMNFSNAIQKPRGINVMGKITRFCSP